jgi:hypothetical protein
MQFTREEKYTYYVLACERGNYYVGRIAGSHANVPRRFHQHRDLLGGAAWTKKHPVEAIEKIVYDQDKWQEDILVYHYMEKFGMDKVRGGSYSQCTLTEAQVREIEIKLRSANNACCGCGKQGHFITHCRHGTTVKKGGNERLDTRCEWKKTTENGLQSVRSSAGSPFVYVQCAKDASPWLIPPRLTSSCLTSPWLTSPCLTSPCLTSLCLDDALLLLEDGLTDKEIQRNMSLKRKRRDSDNDNDNGT